MKKKILVVCVLVGLLSVLAMPMTALASNQAGQGASTLQSTSLEIVAKDDSTAVATITFPPGAPDIDIENPYNNVDGAGVDNEQLYSVTASLPVVRIKNGTGGDLKVILEVGAWTGAVASERYLLVQSSDTTVEATDVTAALSGTVDTGVTIATGTVGHLYLEVTLVNQSGKSGTSTITILGETP